MSRTEGSDDRDQEFLDAVIALGLDIQDLVEAIKDLSDNPDVLEQALMIEGKALMIGWRLRDYRPRLKALKREAASGKPAASQTVEEG